MIRDQEKHKMYCPSLCLENFFFNGSGCLWIEIATKSRNIIMGSRLMDGVKISMIYLLHLAVKL